MLRLQSAFARMAERVLSRAEPRHLTARGKVTSVTKNSGGGISLVEVTVDGVPYTQVRPNGEAGLALGATVDLDGTGEAGSSVDWAVKRVVESAAGGASTDPHGELSTPSIYDVEARVSIMPDGTVITTLDVIVELIAEQYRQRQRIFYETTIRDANTGATLGVGQSIVLERVEGSLHANITSGATSATVNKITGGAEFRFPFNKGIVEWGSELSQYGSVTTVSPTQVTLTSLSRGYDSTTPASHTEGDRVTLRGLPITKEVATVEEYEITVRAINATDGRVSNWSDAFNYEHEGDTTAPTWGGSVGLTATAAAELFQLNWNDADTDSEDISHYQIRYSSDDSTWTTITAGRSTFWQIKGVAGQYTYFQVRAVDRSRNPSGWSSSTRAFMPSTRKTSLANLLTNYEFTNNTTDWALIGTGLSLSHESTIGGSGLGSAEVSGSRSALSEVDLYQDVIMDDTSEQRFLARCFLSRESNFDEAEDKVTLIILADAVEYSIPISGASIAIKNTGFMTMLEVEGVLPLAIDTVTFIVRVHAADTPTESTGVYIDDCGLYLLSEKREV